MTAQAPLQAPIASAVVQKNTDRAAVALSLLCIAHCMVLPVAAIALPFLAAAAEAEWVHWVFAVLAVLASGSIVLFGHGSRTAAFLVPASSGIGLVVFGLFAEQFGIDEAIPTVIGGVLLAGAHGRRLLTLKR